MKQVQYENDDDKMEDDSGVGKALLVISGRSCAGGPQKPP